MNRGFIRGIIIIQLFLFLINTLNAQEVEKKKITLNKNCSKAKLSTGAESKKKNELLNNYDVKHYLIDIEVTPLSVEVSGRSVMTAVSTVEGLDKIVLELSDTITIDSLFVNGKMYAYTHQNDEIIITLDNPVAYGAQFKATVFFHGISDGRGVTQSYNHEWGFNVTWSLSESFHAKEWWPCKEVLTDKADSASIWLTTDSNYTAVSNGLLKKKEKLENGKVKYFWETRFPINYYLISFAVADYQEYSFNAPLNTAGDSVPVNNYIYDSDEYLAQEQDNIKAVSELMEIYSELFGAYPFSKEKYGHALTELGGGMEHQTITTIGNFSYLLVAHELAHQWFGDYVTCGSWQDIWINEGFASYGEYLALEFSGAQDQADEWMKHAHQLAMEKPGGSVYIPFEDVNNEFRIFDYALSYKKGAAIIHMIRYLVDNDNLFFNTLKGFLEKHANSNATGEDFLNFINSKTVKDFSGFFDDWYYGSGYPEYEVNWEKMSDFSIITLEQNNASGSGNIFEIPVELHVATSIEDTILKLKPEEKITRDTIKLLGDIKAVIVDPENWILNSDKDFTDLSNEIFSKKIQLFPNPFHNQLSLNINGENIQDVQVLIRDISGKPIYTDELSSNKITINTKNWPDGVFLVEIIKNNHHLCKKVIKF